MVGEYHDSMDVNLSKLREIVKDREARQLQRNLLQSMGSQRVGHDLVPEQQQWQQRSAI